MKIRSNWLLFIAFATGIAAVLIILNTTAKAPPLICGAVAGIAFGIWWQRRSSTASSHADFHDTFADLEQPQMFALGRLFEATLGGMREGLVVVDHDLRVVASNAAAHQLFTHSGNSLQSQRLTELTPNTGITGAFVEALRGEELSGVKIETHGPDRKVFDLRVVPLTSSNGRAGRGAIGVFFDVTKLERLEHVRQEFLTNVSHELRTPLTAILTFVETLEAGDIDEADRQRFLLIIRRNAHRMHALIDDILELSAIEAGNIQVKSEPIRLGRLVDEVIASLDQGRVAHRVTVEQLIDDTVEISADPRRLDQMLTNLIDNAIKFNREGGRVTVKYERSDGDRIIVEDTGEGIPAQHQERLFERFYRVDRARSREVGGTGLGLAIVKHLARAHGGEVTVHSTLGEGSRFVIELPRQIVQVRAASPSSLRAS
jgi:two-component system, OmpR family, phosphate regulon sensor histidine kinase PhoR